MFWGKEKEARVWLEIKSPKNLGNRLAMRELHSNSNGAAFQVNGRAKHLWTFWLTCLFRSALIDIACFGWGKWQKGKLGNTVKDLWECKGKQNLTSELCQRMVKDLI